MSRNAIRLLGCAAVAAVAIVTSAGAASAHVQVIPDTATQGGEATFAFQVPNEEETATTTKVEVQLPKDQPLGSVAVKATPGWTVALAKEPVTPPIKTDEGEVTERVSTITWTALPAGAIKPGEFEQFVISAGPLPKADSMQFKTVQTYSDGNLVRWIDPEKADGSEPEHPTPTLKLTPAVAEGTSASPATTPATTGSAAAAKAASTTTSDTSAASQSSVNIALGLAVAALIVALVAAVLALRRRSPAAGPSGS